MSLFSLHNEKKKTGKIVTRPMADTISFSYRNRTESGFKESLKESQYLSCGSNFRISKSCIAVFFVLHAALSEACSSR